VSGSKLARDLAVGDTLVLSKGERAVVTGVGPWTSIIQGPDWLPAWEVRWRTTAGEAGSEVAYPDDEVRVEEVQP
jgi:hypothetical protein